MSEKFDPYQEWLDIPADGQPNNHYRLLGLDLYEDDPATIEAAVDQRMEHVRTFQLGQHMQESQEILSQLAAAKVCLCNEERKATYDEELRQQQENGDASSIAVAEEDVDQADGDHGDDDHGDFGFAAEDADSSLASSDTARGEKPASSGGGLLRNKIVIQIVMVTFGGVAALGISMMVGIGGSSPPPPDKNKTFSDTEDDSSTLIGTDRPANQPPLPEPKIDDVKEDVVNPFDDSENSTKDESDPFADRDGEAEDTFNPFEDNSGPDEETSNPFEEKTDNPFEVDGDNPFSEEPDPFEEEKPTREEIVEDDPFQPVDEEDASKDGAVGDKSNDKEPPQEEAEEENPFGETVEDDAKSDDDSADDNPFGETVEDDADSGDTEEEENPFG